MSTSESPKRTQQGDDGRVHHESDDCVGMIGHYWSDDNLLCGQDFMGGTICSDMAGHIGPHSAVCVKCGGDWVNETCTCTCQ